jgi:hypothetical protein
MTNFNLLQRSNETESGGGCGTLPLRWLCDCQSNHDACGDAGEPETLGAASTSRAVGQNSSARLYSFKLGVGLLCAPIRAADHSVQTLHAQEVDGGHTPRTANHFL